MLASLPYIASIILSMNRPESTIYLDYAATTPIDPVVLETMMPYFSEHFYNPSALYKEAVGIQRVLLESRKKVAHELSARPEEIVFFDGGTEANNQAIVGTITTWKKKNPNKIPHAVTSEIEHSSVLQLFKHLEEAGECTVDYLGIDSSGLVSAKELKKTLTENTVIVSIAYGNGEIGVIQNIKEIAKIVRHFKKHNDSVYPYTHTDAAQVAHFCNLNVLQLGIDLMSITGSKIYGPKKIAALYIKTGTELDPLMHGGGQESSLRPGTENIPSIVGLATALELVRKKTEEESNRLFFLKEFFITSIKNIDSSIIVNNNSEKASYLPHIVNITIPNLSSEEILLRLDAKGIACSMKSACTSNREGDSHVILALREHDVKNKKHTGSIRFSFGRDTNEEQLKITLTELTKIVKEMSAFKEQLLGN